MTTFSDGYHRLAAKGRALYERLVEALNQNSIAGRSQAHLPTLPPQYSHQLSQNTLHVVADGTVTNLLHCGFYDKRYTLVEVKNHNVPRSDDQSIYQNYVDSHGQGHHMPLQLRRSGRIPENPGPNILV